MSFADALNKTSKRKKIVLLRVCNLLTFLLNNVFFAKLKGPKHIHYESDRFDFVRQGLNGQS